jgi:hypothetical protein
MDLTDFVDIIGYEGLYKINKNGNVYGVIQNKIKKPQLHKSGYFCIQLSKNSKPKTLKIHRLIALHFIPNDDETKIYVDHIDGVKTNNNILNLRWTTHIDNSRNQISKNNYICEYIRKDSGHITYLAYYTIYDNNKNIIKQKRSRYRNEVEEWVEKMKKEYPNPYTEGRILDI